MFQPVSIFIGSRYSRSRHRSGFVSFITFFSVTGILLGVAALIIVVSVMNGFEGELKKRILGLVPHVVVSQQDGQPLNHRQALQQSLLAREQVHAVTPYLESEALIQSAKSLQGVLMQGINPQAEQGVSIVASHMEYGGLASLTPGSYNLVLGMALARELGVRTNDKVRLVLPTKTLFTPMGRVPVQRTFTVSGLFHVGSQVDSHMVLVHHQDAARLLRIQGEGIDKLRLYLNDAFDAQSISQALSADFPQLHFATWTKSQGSLFEAVKMEKNMMWLMLSLIVAVAAFNVVSALVMVVIDKQAEIGILQTLGMTPNGILQIFITQGMVNGLFGAILGSLLGLGLAAYLNELLLLLGINFLGGYQAQALPVVIQPAQVGLIFCSAVAMAFLATLYPAYRAAKILPAEVLRNE
jgi:lipoprotein-releasing system permease protein